MSFEKILLVLFAVALPCLPHAPLSLGLDLPESDVVTGMIWFAALTAYVPLLAILSGLSFRFGYQPTAMIGAVHGALLSFTSAGWVWTFRDLAPAVPWIVAGLAAVWTALVFVLARAVAGLATRSAARKMRPELICLLIAPLLALGEIGRSISPDLFLPLGTASLAGAGGLLLPVAALGGMLLLAVVVLAFNALLAITIWSARMRRIAVASLAVLILAIVAVPQVAAVPDPIQQRVAIGQSYGTLCAYRDRERRARSGQGYLGQEDLKALIARAADADCDLLLFPEVSAYVARTTLGPLLDLPLSVVAGVRTVDQIDDDAPIVDTFSTNSACLLASAATRITCVEQVDKRYLTPFIEAQLFHRVPALEKIGAQLTEMVTGDGNTDRVTTRSTVLNVPGKGPLGVLVCLELFIPMQDTNDGAGRSVDVPLIFAPIDHSFFPPLASIRALKRRSAALQAAIAGSPVILVSTEDVALMASDGTAIPPTKIEGELFIWRPNTVSGGEG